jgi:putative ABC transport system permease protein
MAYSMNGTERKGNYTGTKVLPSFASNFPEVETGVRMAQTTRVVGHDEKIFTEKKFLFADSTFFRMFSFPLTEGEAGTALSGPRKVLLTQSTAKKYFGVENPVGKTIRVGSTPVDYQITGIMLDPPSTSQIKFDFLASFSSLPALQKITYWEANYTTYLLLKGASSLSSLQPKIAPFMKKEMAAEMKGNDYLTYDLEPFRDVHLRSPYEGFEPNNSITYIYIIGAVAVLILLIACFTYINLSTARSVERAKEVGVRKVAGAGGRQIFWQFLNESVVVGLVAFLLAVGMIQLCLPSFNDLTDKELKLASLFTPANVGMMLVVISCVSFLAGGYPALMLSRFQPIKVLKGSFKTSGSGLLLRKSLLVFQFVITIFLITATVIIQQQLYYIQNKNLGYNREHVLVLPMDAKMNEIVSTIKTGLKESPNILAVARTVDNPVYIKGGYSVQLPEAPDKSIPVTANPVDEDFVKTSGLKILYGSDLSLQDMKDITGDDNQKKTYHFILNEKAVMELGWKPGEAVGKKMNLGDDRHGVVKAVVQDFHFASLHEPIKPLVLFPDDWGSSLLVKTSGANVQQTIAFLEQKWKILVPQRPFEYTFLDESFNKLYSAELRTGKVMNTFAVIAILLACLGLFGLSSYSIQQRTKEIGIRKVLGATVGNIASLLSVQFIRLVAVAFLIAAPLAGFFATRWLQDFSYRISVTWVVFVAVALFTFVLVVMAVSAEAIKAATANPVKNLRTE